MSYGDMGTCRGRASSFPGDFDLAVDDDGRLRKRGSCDASRRITCRALAP
jgi:hypothetical protein